MKYFILLFATAGLLLAEETRREIVNASPTPADDAKPNSDKVPDVYPIYGKIGRVVIFRFKNDADLLAGMEKMIKQAGWFQPVLVVSDANGKEVAYNDDYRFKPDPTIFYEVPKDGEYVLAIYDS